jgi:hypothetical protein
VEDFLEWWAALDNPPMYRRAIHMDTPFEHEFFHVSRSQREGAYQRPPVKMMSGGQWTSVKLIAIVSLFLGPIGQRERPSYQSLQRKTYDRISLLPGNTSTHENGRG